jgi:hypothetical protein
VQQGLNASLLDEIVINLVPVLLGEGIRTVGEPAALMSIMGGRSVRPGCDLRAANTGSGDLLLLNGWNSELGLYRAGDDVRLIVGQQPRPAAMPGCRAGAWGERA